MHVPELRNLKRFFNTVSIGREAASLRDAIGVIISEQADALWCIDEADCAIGDQQPLMIGCMNAPAQRMLR